MLRARVSATERQGGQQAAALKRLEDELRAARARGERTHSRLHRVREALATIFASEVKEKEGAPAL